MNHNDNPAKRLLQILEKAQKVDENKSMGDAFAEIFDNDPNQRSEILRNLGELQKLPLSIRSEVQSIKKDHSIYLDKINRIEKALSKINFGAKWRNFQQGIDEATITQLTFCSELLSNNSKFKHLEKKDLNKLKEKVQSFKNELSGFDIDTDLNQLIFEKLNDIERAIFDYQLTGSALIQKEVESAMGQIVLHPALVEKDKSVVRKFFSLLSYISTTIDVVERAPKLTEFTQRLLNEAPWQ